MSSMHVPTRHILAEWRQLARDSCSTCTMHIAQLLVELPCASPNSTVLWKGPTLTLNSWLISKKEVCLFCCLVHNVSPGSVQLQQHKKSNCSNGPLLPPINSLFRHKFQTKACTCANAWTSTTQSMLQCVYVCMCVHNYYVYIVCGNMNHYA